MVALIGGILLASGPGAIALNSSTDGQTDIIWHLNTDGANFSWLVNGLTFVDAVRLPSCSSPGWKLVGTGDFDRDSQTDLLFRDTDSGQMAVWFMTNTVIKLATPLTGLIGNPDYYAVGTGDFNGDGISDVLWHHHTADQTVVWFMNSTGPTNYTLSAVGWCPLMNDTSWRACTTGDFNNDSHTDIVWRNRATGQNVVWLMDGTNRTASVRIAPKSDPNWDIVAAGHFNREGHTDLVWRHQTNGINGIWLMGGADGLTLLGEYMDPSIIPGQSDQAWVVGGVGGYTNTMALTAEIDATAGSITLRWQPGLTSRATIERKLPAESTWTTLTNNYSRFTYTDGGRSTGHRYEYRVNTNYILTAINAPPIEHRGQVIMVVENSMAKSLRTELAQLKTNLIGDGWSVVRTNVTRHDDKSYANNWSTITNLKSFIISHYNSSVTNVVLLIGHVPIPYSGSSASDGHDYFVSREGSFSQAGHNGAWPADAYYGNINEAAWTDTRVNTKNIVYPRNTNRPGDRKFDNDTLPATSDGIPLHLAVGRIDFADLPAFPKTETQLLRQYLNKNLRYRTGLIAVADRAALGGFLSPGRAYSPLNDVVFHAARANATRWFGIGPGKLVHADIYDQTSTNYSWGFHAGNGDSQGHQGERGFIHLTSSLADPSKEPRTAFYFIHGSWFADWNLTSNNLLRATLATPNYGLAAIGFSATTFLPFQMQTLALGEPLANAMLRTCAAAGNNVPRWLTIIGDPTLRLKMPNPIAGFSAKPTRLGTARTSANFKLSWNALAGAAAYYIYRSTNGIDGSWSRLTIATDRTYEDIGAPRNSLYMVRAAILATCGAGSYTNLTQGVFAP